MTCKCVEAETYRQMHEDAKELGYPSILEALEDLERRQSLSSPSDETLRGVLEECFALACDYTIPEREARSRIADKARAALSALPAQGEPSEACDYTGPDWFGERPTNEEILEQAIAKLRRDLAPLLTTMRAAAPLLQAALPAQGEMEPSEAMERISALVADAFDGTLGSAQALDAIDDVAQAYRAALRTAAPQVDEEGAGE